LGTEFRLTDQVFNQYRGAWKEITKERVLDATVDAALIRSEAAGANTSDLESGYAEIAHVVEILDRHQLTVRSYLLVDAAFARAMTDSRLPKAFREQMLPARADNITFVLNRETGAAWLREIEPIKKELEERRRRASRR
jgi:3-oxoacyl-ACP reductase-like protein